MIGTAPGTPSHRENTDAAPAGTAGPGTTLTKEQLDRLGAELILPAPAPRT